MTTSRRSFARVPRAKFDEHTAALERQRDRAIAAKRAHADWIASYLEQRADAHDLDARDTRTPADRRLAHRMAAADLRALARDIENGPPDA